MKAYIRNMFLIICNLNVAKVALGGLAVILLATGPKVRGFKTGGGRLIFKSDKNPQHDFLGSKK
jgi:hypothetical protein